MATSKVAKVKKPAKRGLSQTMLLNCIYELELRGALSVLAAPAEMRRQVKLLRKARA